VRHKHDVEHDVEDGNWTLIHDHSVVKTLEHRMHTHTIVTGPAYVDTTRYLTEDDADA
jgi:hypothetical protein